MNMAEYSEDSSGSSCDMSWEKFLSGPSRGRKTSRRFGDSSKNRESENSFDYSSGDDPQMEAAWEEVEKIDRWQKKRIENFAQQWIDVKEKFKNKQEMEYVWQKIDMSDDKSEISSVSNEIEDWRSIANDYFNTENQDWNSEASDYSLLSPLESSLDENDTKEESYNLSDIEKSYSTKNYPNAQNYGTQVESIEEYLPEDKELDEIQTKNWRSIANDYFKRNSEASDYSLLLQENMGVDKSYRLSVFNYSESPKNHQNAQFEFIEENGLPVNRLMVDKCGTSIGETENKGLKLENETEEITPYTDWRTDSESDDKPYESKGSESKKGTQIETDPLKIYGCGRCPYSTSLPSNLERHTRTHTKYKPYACESCSYKASNSGLLKRHMRVHTGEKPYSCQLCDYRATQSYILKQHVIYRHKRTFPFTCELCKFQCTRAWLLKQHQIKIHPNEK